MYIYIVPPKEPKFISYEFINKAQLFRNVNLIGDCYISHRNITDFYKIIILKNIHQEFRKMHKLYLEEITQNIPKDEELKDNEDNELKTNSDKQETTKFEYSSKALLDIVKVKYNKCQEFIENNVLSSEEYYSSKRKKMYKLIPINIEPPKIIEEQDMNDENNKKD